MGLLDLFKKKKTDSTFPENELERALIDAATQASARSGFYQKLLWSDIVVLTGEQEGIEQGPITFEKDSTVKFITFENGIIPIFTSTNRIFDKGIIKDQVAYLAIKGQDLFGAAKGATFILNPYSDYGKELIPQEIENLLNGSIFDQQNEMTIEEDTAIQIGQPANYPTELVNALSKLFERKETVRAAYIALVKMNSDPHLMIGIDLEGELSSITNEAGPLAEKLLKNEIIDFIKIDDRGGVSEYFLTQTKPFYKRK